MSTAATTLTTATAKIGTLVKTSPNGKVVYRVCSEVYTANGYEFVKIKKAATASNKGGVGNDIAYLYAV